MGILLVLLLFWNLFIVCLDGVVVVVGIGFINVIGNLLGFVSLFVIGWLMDMIYMVNVGVGLLGVCVMFVGVLMLVYGCCGCLF